MRAILLYYLYTETVNGGLGFDKGTAVAIMSIYGSLVYMSSIIGGWLADRVFGTANTVFYGGIFIMFGHIALAYPGDATAFYISMALIIIGTGLLKPNVSSVVGDLYTKEDTRRDSGFSIFYMGINLGGLLAPLIVGTLGQKYNYHLGFGAAAVGMLLGLIVFALTRKKTSGLQVQMCRTRCLKISDRHRNRGYHCSDRGDYCCTNRRADDQSVHRPCKYSRYFDSYCLFHYHVYKQKSGQNRKISSCRLRSFVYRRCHVLGHSGTGSNHSCGIR